MPISCVDDVTVIPACPRAGDSVPVVPVAPCAGARTMTRVRAKGTVVRVLWSARRRLLFGSLLGVLLAAAVQLFYVTAGGNFHEVIAGDVYRSAQPSADELEALIRRYGIRTVVNLRGDNADDDWYWEEKRTAARNGAVVVDVGLWGNAPADIDQLQILVDTLDHGAPPFLLHCYSGADRAGMASVVALLLRSDTELAEAREQLAWWLGHNPLGKAGCHDRLFERYDEWLHDRQQTHAPRLLRQWVRTVYRPELCARRAVCQTGGPGK